MKRFPVLIIIVCAALFLITYPQAGPTFAQSSDPSQMTSEEAEQILLSYTQRMGWPPFSDCSAWENNGYDCASKIFGTITTTPWSRSIQRHKAIQPDGSPVDSLWGDQCRILTSIRLDDLSNNYTLNSELPGNLTEYRDVQIYLEDGNPTQAAHAQMWYKNMLAKVSDLREGRACTYGGVEPRLYQTLVDLMLEISPLSAEPATPTATEESPTPELTPLSPQVEIEYTSKGVPYRGVAADGISYLQIILVNTDPDRTVTVYPSADVGELKFLDGKDIWQGNIIIPPLSNQQILYRPPAYISQDSALTERIELNIDGATQVLWGQKASLSLEFITDEGASAVVQKEILVFRPPVRMVHGYLGSTETWTSMENYLGVNKFMSSSSDYRAAIELMAMDLKADILRMMEGYDGNGFRVGKVDIVSHSMGGLISRYLVERDPDPRNLMRKVIMLGTPNHGVDDMFDDARSWASWYTETHQVAGLQLRYNDPFILSLNEGEREGRHLNPDVEYANLVGQISCLFKKEDGVVPHTSSHLNGVPIYTFAGTVHTGAIEYVCDTLKGDNQDVSITESPLVFEKVRELLLQPIPREQFENASIQVIKGEGEVTVREPDPNQPWELLLQYPAQLEPYYHLQTGNNSKAVIGLFLNQERWGLVALAPNSEIMFRYSSPATVSVWMVKGNARFMARRDNHKKFEIAIGQKYNETWQTLRPQASVFDQDTDFVISASEQIEVYSLDGRVQIEVQNEDPNVVPLYVQKEIKSNQVVSILANTVQDAAQPPAAWWSDEFYPQSISVSERSVLSQNWFYWGAIPGALCFGAAFIVLIAGVFTKDKKISTLGTILIAVVICSTMIAAAFYAGSQILAPEHADPGDTAPNDPVLPQEFPFVDVQPTAFVPAEIPPTFAPVEPTSAVEPEAPFPQELSPEASIYSFASCLEPCLSDRTNNRSTFPEKTTKIYFRYDYSWISPESDYIRLWKYGGQEWARYQCKWDGVENGVFESSLREPAGLRSGDWTMEVYVNGALVIQQTITVQGTYNYWDPAGTIDQCK